MNYSWPQVDEEEYRGFTIKIFQEEYDAESPRDWDNLGHMVCWHRNYNLGDEQPKCSLDEWFEQLACDVDPTAAERIEWWRYEATGKRADEADKRIQAIIDKAINNNIVAMWPLYLIDHSGIAMNCGGYSHCDPQGWDWGQVGWIYATREDVLREYSVKRITKDLKAKVAKLLRSEVEVYSWYLEGAVWWYRIEDKNGEEVDGLSGFYGYDYEENDLLPEARNTIDWHIKRETEKHAKKLKGQIRNRVPLAYREAFELGR